MSASGLVRQELLSGSTVVTSTSGQNIDYNAVLALPTGSVVLRTGPTARWKTQQRDPEAN